MEDEFKDIVKNWIKCFSESKQRHYYFNSKSGESLWTMKEVENRIKQNLKTKENAFLSNSTDVVMMDLLENDDKESDAMDIEIVADVIFFIYLY